MSENKLCFSVDADKLGKLNRNFLKSSEGAQAIREGQFQSEERLYLSLLDTELLNSKLVIPQKRLIVAGESFKEAYFLVAGEVQIHHGPKAYRLGAGSVLGLAEGLVGLPSRFTATAIGSVQIKVLPFFKVESIVKTLPPELRSILVTIVKRNLAAN